MPVRRNAELDIFSYKNLCSTAFTSLKFVKCADGLDLSCNTDIHLSHQTMHLVFILH